jgi:hypothetical protein
VLAHTPERVLADNSARILYDKLQRAEREKIELRTAHDTAQQQLRRLTAALQASCKRQQEQQEQQEHARQEAERQEGILVSKLQDKVTELEAANEWMAKEREENLSLQEEEGERLRDALEQASAAKELLVSELQKIAQGGGGGEGARGSGERGGGEGGTVGGSRGSGLDMSGKREGIGGSVGGIGVSPLAGDNSARGMGLHQKMCTAVAELRQRQQRQMAEAEALVTAIEMRYVQGYDVHDPAEKECAADMNALQRLVTQEAHQPCADTELAEQEVKLAEQCRVNGELKQSLQDLRSRVNQARMNQLL